MINRPSQKNAIVDLFYMLPAVIFVLSIILVRLHLFSMPMTDIYWSEATNATVLSDLFNYWKSMAVCAAGFLAIVAIIVGYFQSMIRWKKDFLYIPIIVYVLDTIISLVFSNYKYFAIHGMSEHFEGTFVLLAYMAMVIFLSNAVDSKRRLKILVFSALGVSFLLGILGVTQSLGHDFFSTVWGQKLITPNYTLETGIKSWDMIDMLSDSGKSAYDFSFTEGQVYQTVYNINYVPLYLQLVISVSAFLFIFASVEASRNKKLVSLATLMLYGLLLYNFFTANSGSGYVGLAVMAIIFLIIFHNKLVHWLKPIVCLVVVLALVLTLTMDRWIPEVKDLFGRSIRMMASIVYADTEPNDVNFDYKNAPATQLATIDYINCSGNCLDFSLNGNILRITRNEDNGSYELSDEEGKPLFITDIDNEPGWFQILDDRYHDYVEISLTNINEMNYFVIHTRGYSWNFRYTGESFVYLNSVGKEISLQRIEHSPLIRNYDFASRRGGIWASTIPLLKSFIAFGSGADCFVFSFPQNDYATKYNISGVEHLNQVTDKAHNLYLQYWVNTGLISLLAWLTMVGYYLVGAVKQFRKRGFVDFCDFVNGGIFCGICGFLAVAFFNDGSVNTMPMFYTMLGTGLAINMRDKWADENVQTYSEKKQPETMPEI